MGFIRTILIGIDAVIYTILEQIFQLIINLANFDLFTGDVLKEFSTKIYLILGLVMVFKLMLSFIQILIDPDKINDKETGVVNILKRVVISMILIVLVPSIFSFAKQVQNLVIPIIPKVVLGVPIDVDDSQISYDETITDPIAKLENEQGNVMISSGKLMAYYSFLPFFYYNSGCDGLGGNETLGTLFGTTPADKSMNVKIYSVLDAVPHVNDKSGCSTTSDGYDYNYRYLISTLVGAYLVYVLVTVALKIAIRAIKFGICELIAPIPIASYIDPKSSKKAFDNWVSTSVKVYLDLFVRLIVVYFIVYIFKILFDGQKFIETLGKYGPFQGLLVALFIIVGLLYFAKEMPKFVSDMLGVPDGFSDIGDMFKGQGWRAIGSAAGAAAAPIGTAIGNYRYARQNGDSIRRSLLSAGAGSVASLGRGAAAIANGKGFKDSFWNNVATTTGNAHRRVNERAIKRQLKKEYQEGSAKVDSNISDIRNQFQNEGNTLNSRRNNLANLINGYTDSNGNYHEGILDRMSNLQQQDRNLQTNLSSAQTNVDDSRRRVSSAEARVNGIRANLENIQNNRNNAQNFLNTAQENARTRMETLTNQQNINRNELLNKKSTYEQYLDAVQKHSEMSKTVQYWRNRLNNAATPADRQAAKNELTKAINNYEKSTNLIAQMQKDNNLEAANASEISNWIRNVNNDISTLDRNQEIERRNLQNEIDRDIDLARQNLENAERELSNINNDLSTAESELTIANNDLSANETDYNSIQEQIKQNQDKMDNLSRRYEDVNAQIAAVDSQISSLDERREKAINSAEKERPREIKPAKEAILASLNRAQGLSSVTGSTYVDVSQQLSSIRSSYYTGEAMKKLKEEGSKVTKRFDLTDGHGHTINATYSDVAAALADVQRGKDAYINGIKFEGSPSDLQELFSLVEKNAAIEYINMVDRGEIKNTTIEEGNKQVAAMLSGLQIDDATRKELQEKFNTNKGNFYKALSDYAKQLETHGKRLQAYERAKNDKS